nr:hypothetical protein [Parabacteroides merdae]
MKKYPELTQIGARQDQ